MAKEGQSKNSRASKTSLFCQTVVGTLAVEMEYFESIPSSNVHMRKRILSICVNDISNFTSIF